jgi:hypothetical protein
MRRTVNSHQTFKSLANISRPSGAKPAWKPSGSTNLKKGIGNGLVAINLDRDILADEFKALNPATLATRGKRGCQFWYRLQPSTYPNGKAVWRLQAIVVDQAKGAKFLRQLQAGR